MSRILSGHELSQLISKVDAHANSGEQIQPAGYDVSVNKIFSYFNEGTFTLSIAKSKQNSALAELPLREGKYFDLERGAYYVELNEITTIPRDSIGILFPRSTLLRNGLDLRTALFDPGYSGQPKVMLVCYRPAASIERYARIGQLVILQSSEDFESQYAGQYQGESGTTATAKTAVSMHASLAKQST